MGFFSSLLKGVGAVVGAVINPAGTIAKLFSGDTKAAAPVATGRALSATGAARSIAEGVALGPVLGTPRLGQPGVITGGDVARTITGVQKGFPPRTSAALPLTGGNGKVAKRTIVQTINLDNGAVVNEIVLEGAPFLMNKAVRELERTSRKLRKANRKIPTRPVKVSLAKQLTDRVLNETIQNIGDHHHHNGT